MTTILAGGPILQVADVAASISYFTQRLGFEPGIRFPDAEHPTYGSVSRDGFEIHLAQDGRPAQGARIYMWIDEGIDQVWRDCKDSGAFVGAKPQEEPWGGLIFGVRDLDGNSLQFLQRHAHGAG